jgi:[ribosomal protein S5]-alanine N-acetyltransferase
MLITKRLYLRSPQISDFDDLYQLQTDPHVMKYIGNGVRDKTAVQDSLKNALKHEKKFGYSLGSLFEKETDLFVGRAGLIHLAFDDESTEIEVAYAIHMKFWGRGYGTEIAQALVNWGFENLTIDRLVGIVHPENIRSQKVLQNVGMSYAKDYHYNGMKTHFYQIERSAII